jgi:hypothetical protein
VAGGQLTTYLGSYDDYFDAKAHVEAPAESEVGQRHR